MSMPACTTISFHFISSFYFISLCIYLFFFFCSFVFLFVFHFWWWREFLKILLIRGRVGKKMDIVAFYWW